MSVSQALNSNHIAVLSKEKPNTFIALPHTCHLCGGFTNFIRDKQHYSFFFTKRDDVASPFSILGSSYSWVWISISCIMHFQKNSPNHLFRTMTVNTDKENQVAIHVHSSLFVYVYLSFGKRPSFCLDLTNAMKELKEQNELHHALPKKFCPIKSSNRWI